MTWSGFAALGFAVENARNNRRNRCRDSLTAPPAIASPVIGRLLPALPTNRKRRSGVSGRHVSVDRAHRVSELDCDSYLRVADLLRRSAAAWRDIPLEHPAPVQPKNDFQAATPSEFGGPRARFFRLLWVDPF